MLPIHVPGGSCGATAAGDGAGAVAGVGETTTGAAGPAGPGAALGAGAEGTATTPGGSVRWEPGVGVAGIATKPGGSEGWAPGAGALGTAGGGTGGADRTVVATKVAIVCRIRFVFIFSSFCRKLPFKKGSSITCP